MSHQLGDVIDFPDNYLACIPPFNCWQSHRNALPCGRVARSNITLVPRLGLLF